ncbi:methyltransferase [Raphidocelis subcapitata]|uniref:Methyltransferase n=1 Tax=Raphidocelis subcapitata TaxID=307507 RepID=A0A2V0NPI8_9CHLO|nr:methyltransferase [Raphidocelis subcapitata]|eukprot:GBF89538.1 methyltransferase [Raphidocelis subcapitata]
MHSSGLRAPSRAGCVQRQQRLQPVKVRPARPAAPRASSSSTAAAVDKQQPDWTGDKLMSQLVNFLINTPPIWEVMKYFAKRAMKGTAAKKGVDWDAYTRGLLAAEPELEALRARFSTPGFPYPDYYLKPFHTYPTGNLEWLAAAEVRPASTVIACRTFKEMEDAAAAEARLRRGITATMKADLQRRGLPPPSNILDAGCSTGISTRWLADAFPDAALTGLDASPYMLAVAELEQRRDPLPTGRPIAFEHGLAEATRYADASWDMVAYQFIAHECPQSALRAFASEAARILRPGGVVVFVDNNPRSETIQNLPPALFALMKSTEPWSDEYYSFDLEAALREAGFEDVYTAEADHRHRAVFGGKPK